MKIRETVGQIFVFGFSGHSSGPELKRMLKKYNPGGLILFSENYQSPEQLADLTAEINPRRKKLPLFFLVDPEGGRVNRFGRPFTHFPATRD